MSIDTVRVFLSGTNVELAEFRFMKDPDIVKKFFPSTGGPPTLNQGFISPPSSQANAGQRIDLLIEVAVKPGTTADQFISELSNSNSGTAEILANGALANIRIVQHTQVAVQAPAFDAPTLSQWGGIIMMLLLLTTGAVFIRRQQLSAEMALTGSDFQPNGMNEHPLFIPAIYFRVLAWTLAGVILGLRIATWLFGPITTGQEHLNFYNVEDLEATTRLQPSQEQNQKSYGLK